MLRRSYLTLFERSKIDEEGEYLRSPDTEVHSLLSLREVVRKGTNSTNEARARRIRQATNAPRRCCVLISAVSRPR